MSAIEPQFKYTEEHEWAEKTADRMVRIGITDFAQHQLGDIVFVELPAAGKQVEAGEALGVIESVKTVADLFSPVKGNIISVNEALLDAPELLNNEPYGSGWIMEIEVDGEADEALAPLLTAEAYAKLTDEQA
ncbi:glycine cleavage system protein GcvH [Paenibacillus sp. TAB 01]|uniref:glycine cleavage system protein GcvH n=1 Tax=Paenibacillus sp. TAB 01 TaxID=3368988 RepID=UPI00375384B2